MRCVRSFCIAKLRFFFFKLDLCPSSLKIMCTKCFSYSIATSELFDPNLYPVLPFLTIFPFVSCRVMPCHVRLQISLPLKSWTPSVMRSWTCRGEDFTLYTLTVSWNQLIVWNRISFSHFITLARLNRTNEHVLLPFVLKVEFET